MANNSKIEWTDMTINPVVGCTPISAGGLGDILAKLRTATHFLKPEATIIRAQCEELLAKYRGERIIAQFDVTSECGGGK